MSDGDKDGPKGSGWFAAAAGVVFVLVLVASFFYDLKRLSPYALLQAWLLFAGVVLLFWGAYRIRKGKNEMTVGQNTINFVVALIGATIAILTLLVQSPSPPQSQPVGRNSATAPAPR